MKRALPTLTLLLLLILAFSSIPSFAQQDENTQDESSEVEDDAPVARVARLSFVEGDVAFLRAGLTEWAAAVENLPLLAGDQIYVGQGARAEVQLARGSYIRLFENTALGVSDLSDTSAQFEVTEGIAIIRVERLDAAFKRFEVDTPNSALLLKSDGLYRINVRGDDDSEVIVRRGSAEVSTDDGNFRVREGHRLTVDTSQNGRLEIAVDTSNDDWDQWSYARDTAIDNDISNAAPDYVTSYETTYTNFYGVSDLSSYGSWFNHSDYGYCWRPRVGHDWVHYRDGQWLWIPAAGWTWHSRDRWGWAPYHYGRWVIIAGYGWSWVPGIAIGRQQRAPWFLTNSFRYYRWRPALVRFYDCPTPRGRYVAWHPLAPHERWRRPDRDLRGGDHSHLRYPSARAGSRRPDDERFGIRLPRERSGVSILPVDDFAKAERSRLRPVAPGRDVSDWVTRGARAGLPEISPSPIAAAPSIHDGNNRGPRRVVVPPGEIARRPVVTRNRPPDLQAGITAPARERRLINPRAGTTSDNPSLRERRSRGGEDRAARPAVPTVRDSERKGESFDRPSRDRLRVPALPQQENSSGDSAARERRRERRGSDAVAPAIPENQQGGESNNSAKERRRNRPEIMPVPADNPAVEKPRENEERRRERRPPTVVSPGNGAGTEETRRREEARPRPRDEERARERPQPPPEVKQERRQEKEERRQEKREERESRKRPEK
jgi:hypothetical protein